MTGAGRLIHTGQVIVDLVMRVPKLPERGGETIATAASTAVGGGFNVLAAAVRDGAAACYLGAIGDGEHGKRVLHELTREGVTVLQKPLTGRDTGYCVALVEPDGERSFLTVLGAESEPTRLPRIAKTGDVIYVSGYSLVSPRLAEELLGFLSDIAAAVPGISVVFDPAPVISEVDPALLQRVLAHATVLTLNEREAGLLAGAPAAGQASTGAATGTETGTSATAASSLETASALASHLASQHGCDVVLRLGKQGCVVASAQNNPRDLGKSSNQQAGQHTIVIPAPRVQAVDTNGAGDAHTGVLCGQLARGSTLTAAAERANIAAALAVTRSGPATAPTAGEINAAKW